MSNKTKKTAEAVETVETVTIENMVEATVTKRRGRPVVEGSARQVRLAAQAARGGEAKRGRPSNPSSARQQRLAEMAARREANGGAVKRGRPKMIKAEASATNVE